jgi:hypothetical protein
MASTMALDGQWDDGVTHSYRTELLEVLRVIAVAGIGFGLVGAGLGGRLAMFFLRLTSPDSVRGTLSDDGFVIGRFTLVGTYNLAMVGAGIGIIGACAYIAVAPWLIGPTWFRRVTVGAAAAGIAGSGLIHHDGVDFQALQPQWFAIGLFILLPLLFGIGLSFVVDRVSRRESWTRRGRLEWILPLALTAIAATSELRVALPFVAAAVAALLPVRRLLLRRIRESRRGTFLARLAYFAIAAYGFVALAEDLGEFV